MRRSRFVLCLGRSPHPPTPLVPRDRRVAVRRRARVARATSTAGEGRGARLLTTRQLAFSGLPPRGSWRNAPEGECATMRKALIIDERKRERVASSFHHFVVPLPLGGRRGICANIAATLAFPGGEAKARCCHFPSKKTATWRSFFISFLRPSSFPSTLCLARAARAASRWEGILSPPSRGCFCPDLAYFRSFSSPH